MIVPVKHSKNKNLSYFLNLNSVSSFFLKKPSNSCNGIYQLTYWIYKAKKLFKV